MSRIPAPIQRISASLLLDGVGELARVAHQCQQREAEGQDVSACERASERASTRLADLIDATGPDEMRRAFEQAKERHAIEAELLANITAPTTHSNSQR